MTLSRILSIFSVGSRVPTSNIAHSLICMVGHFVLTRKYYMPANIECFLVVGRVLFTGKLAPKGETNSPSAYVDLFESCLSRKYIPFTNT